MIRFALLLLFLLCITPVKAADIAVAFTKDRVEVDTDFSGAELTLFGAVTGVETPEANIDIIATIEGPAARFRVRRLEQRNLIWTPGESLAIENAPGLFLTSATRPIADIAPLPDQAALHLDTEHLNLQPGQHAEQALFVNAFLDEVEDAGLYRDAVGDIDFKKGALFTINVDLPANTPVGAYQVVVYLYQDGVMLGRDTTELIVNKVGIERRIYEFAHNQPVSYGIFCVMLSLFAGWAAGFAFRKQ